MSRRAPRGPSLSRATGYSIMVATGHSFKKALRVLNRNRYFGPQVTAQRESQCSPQQGAQGVYRHAACVVKLCPLPDDVSPKHR